MWVYRILNLTADRFMTQTYFIQSALGDDFLAREGNLASENWGTKGGLP